MTSKNYYKSLIGLMGLLLAGLVAGCGSGGDGGVVTAQPGTLSVSMTDAPACGFDEVNVTVSKVRVHQSSSADDKAAGWTDITLNPSRKINLLDLNDPTQPNFALESLGETPLEAGQYTQLRLVLAPNANSVVLSGPSPSTEIPLETPSGIQSGIKLIHQFTVNSGERVDLLLDFDACKSIVKTGSGKYKLKPVIKVIPFVLNGIDGFIDKSLIGSHVIVTAQKNGEIVRATVPNSVSGKFFLARLDAPEDYDVVMTADGHATAVIAGVPVSTGASITPISTDVVPIILLTSATQRTVGGTVTLNPAVDDESVLLTAKQSLTSGPTVTVKSDPATVLDDSLPVGDYSYTMTLPTAPPTLGGYSLPLPIPLAQQATAVGGKYVVEASAVGYATQSANVDISAASAPQNFTLIP
jgi:hypothetical protein